MEDGTMKRIVALLLASIPVLLWAQQPLCPPADPNCPWNEQTLTLVLRDPDCNAQVTFKWRICNGRLEVALDESGIMILEGCMGWDRLQWYHYNYSGLLDYITQALLTALHIPPTFFGNQPPPPCGQGTITTASVYTASCGIWLKCRYHYEGSVTRECERGHDGIDPLWDPANQTITTTKWFSCGQTCCVREYEICWKRDPIAGDQIFPLRLIRKQKLIDCTGQSNFDRPCEDGC
jgi:hypothetical protein